MITIHSSLLILFCLDILIFNISPSNLLQATNPGKKRKRSLTEERKAKKTVCYGLATIWIPLLLSELCFLKCEICFLMLLSTDVQENKRKKRAKQRIADGVKRPKLQHVTKPKKPCHFYDHGKCQQVSFIWPPNLFHWDHIVFFICATFLFTFSAILWAESSRMVLVPLYCDVVIDC